MSQSPLRIVFAGTPDFAAAHLSQLLKSNHQVCAVYTQPDRPAGRGKKLQPSPVKIIAEQHDIAVFQPQSLKSSEAREQLAALEPDLMVVVAYGLLLPKAVLDIPRFGCINVHASILPRWRGAAPIQRAIQAGDQESGICIMQMDEGLDTGDVLFQSSYELSAEETGGSLHQKLMEMGCNALSQVVADYPALVQNKVAQDDLPGEPTYAAKLTKQEAKIDWCQPARNIERMVRAFNPWPVAYMLCGKERVKVWQVECLSRTSTAAPGEIICADRQGVDVQTGGGVIRLLRLQLPNSRALSVGEILNAKKERFQVGSQLG